jgi:membrane-bound metal-dependent hydrolase YbcI (DUF457 family)
VLFLGHIAASILIADSTGADRHAAVAGNLVPDVTDKTLGWVFKLTPSRWLFHGLPVFALLAAASRLVLKGPQWRGFVLGYAGHLICDLWAGSKVPWFAPWGPKPPMKRSKKSPGKWVLYLLPEVVGAAIVWAKTR